jgi:thiol-disulfide isomerase/thioredoxin
MRFLLGLFLMALSIHAEIVGEVRMTVDAGDLPAAGRLVADYCKAHGTTPDVIFANSWIARGYLERGKLDDADKNAMETRAWALTLVMHRKLDAEPVLPLALSAAIEVHAQVLERRGQRSEAIAFLRGEEARWAASSMRARIQKNLNLLTLEGRPAPPINITEWTGDTKPEPLAALRGHPVLLFFWAHWCPDCKADSVVIQALNAKYGPRGLKIIGPTMRYGYIGGGEDATPAKENAWIAETFMKYYERIGAMPAPISEETMRAYGVSTTPTFVLVDKHGVVRLYHPGAMSYQELAAPIEKLLAG